MSTDEEIEQFALSRVGSTVNGKWTLDRLIGVGGMAAVYAATHRNTKRAALKILHPEFAAQEGIQKRFLREGYVANMIGHSAVATVDDDDVTEDGCAFLVMELVEGETLEARVRRKGPLPPSEVLAFMDQVLHVVATAHGKGIVHRDLKPENLLLSKDGQVKLLDFGIARIRQLSSDPTKTLTEGLMGTPAFMPPEQARGRWAEVDAQSDVWSIGATMFTLLTGRYVHEAQTMNEALAMAMMQRAPLVESYRTGLPAYVSDLVNRALIFEKNERWPNATVMLLAVRKAAARFDEEEIQASAQEAARAVHADSADPEILIGVEDDAGEDDYGSVPPSDPSGVAIDPPEEDRKSEPLASLLGKAPAAPADRATHEPIIQSSDPPRAALESSPKQLAVTTQLSSEEVDALHRAADERALDPYPSEPSRPSQPSMLEEELTAVMQRPDLGSAAAKPVRAEPAATKSDAPAPVLVNTVRPAAGAPATREPDEQPVSDASAAEAVDAPRRAETEGATLAADDPHAAASAPDAESDPAGGDRISDELPTSIKATDGPLSSDTVEASGAAKAAEVDSESEASDEPKPGANPAGATPSNPEVSKPSASRPKEPDRAGLVAIALAATGRSSDSELKSSTSSRPPSSATSSIPPSATSAAPSHRSTQASDLPKSKIVPVPDVPSDGERISRTVHTTTARAAFSALPKQVTTRALATIGAVVGVILLIVIITLSGDDEVPTPATTGATPARTEVLLAPEPDGSSAPAPEPAASTAPKATARDESQAVDLEALPVLPNQQIQRKWTPPPKKKDDKDDKSVNPFAKYTDIAKRQAEKRKKTKE